jgi:hypothetical protein
MTSKNVGIKNKSINFSIPGMMILLNTIERFLRETNKDGVILNITWRLFHVYLLLQISMQEDIFNIHLVDLPFM